MMNDSDNKHFEKMSKPKQYAIGIGSCAVVLAALALIVSNVTKSPDVRIESSTTSVTEQQNVDANIKNVPDTRQTPTTEIMIFPTTQVTTETQGMITVTDTTKETEAMPAPTSYSLPLGTDIGQDYSNGVPVFSDIMSDWRTHDGVDFNGAVGDGVKAIADGKITKVYDDELWGTVAVVDHGGGVVARYCGLQPKSTLTVGAVVKKNDKIGTVGEIPVEADAEFPHLHLEIEVDGKNSDPLEVMKYYE